MVLHPPEVEEANAYPRLLARNHELRGREVGALVVGEGVKVALGHDSDRAQSQIDPSVIVSERIVT